MTINIVVPYNKYCSFYSCAYALASWLSNYDLYISQQLKFGVRNIIIYDTVFSNSFKFVPYMKYTLFWVDSPLKNTKKIVLNEIIVCASWEAQLRKQEGFNVLDVVGRLINPLAFSLELKEWNERKYDIVIVGNYDPAGDRKNIKLTEKILNNLDKSLRICYIGNYDFNTTKHNIDKFTNISELEKYKLFNDSRFILHLGGAEGFFMPACEGMACGCYPIMYKSYNFVPDLENDYVKKLLIDYKTEIENTKYGQMIKVYPKNEKDVVDILNNLDKYEFEPWKIRNCIIEYQVQQYYKLINII